MRHSNLYNQRILIIIFLNYCCITSLTINSTEFHDKLERNDGSVMGEKTDIKFYQEKILGITAQDGLLAVILTKRLVIFNISETPALELYSTDFDYKLDEIKEVKFFNSNIVFFCVHDFCRYVPYCPTFNYFLYLFKR